MAGTRLKVHLATAAGALLLALLSVPTSLPQQSGAWPGARIRALPAGAGAAEAAPATHQRHSWRLPAVEYVLTYTLAVEAGAPAAAAEALCAAFAASVERHAAPVVAELAAAGVPASVTTRVQRAAAPLRRDGGGAVTAATLAAYPRDSGRLAGGLDTRSATGPRQLAFVAHAPAAPPVLAGPDVPTLAGGGVAFALPEAGGVHVLGGLSAGALDTAAASFAAQLRSLSGAGAALPDADAVAAAAAAELRVAQELIDGRGFLATRIPASAARAAADALDALDAMAAPGADRLGLARRAVQRAADVGGAPGMLPRVKFPLDHIFAIFAPFWMPMLLPLVLGGRQELRRYRKLVAKSVE